LSIEPLNRAALPRGTPKGTHSDSSAISSPPPAKHLVSAKDYAPNDYYSDVYDQLVFYGSCLTSEEAEALKNLLHDDDKKFKLLKLNYVETDI
jgi:hypothetical protein